MCAKTQTLTGISSLTSNDKHFIFWDIEGVTLQQAKVNLSIIQSRYGLSNIYIESDNNGKTMRAWCFSEVTFKKLCQILSDSLDFIDYNFFYYTVKRRKATLRVSPKKGRERQKVISILKTFPVPFVVNEKVEKVVYDTGIEKRGISILIGER